MMMSANSETVENELIVQPDPKWFLYDNQRSDDGYTLDFPPLHYKRVRHLDLPLNTDDVVLGGSYNIFSQLPKYLERCAILEHLYMPYRFESKYFKINVGFLQWPRINLSAYTYIPDPQKVYFKRNGKFIACMRFNTDYIELEELCD